ncbi:MAG: 7-carboxy-7-deazaguanine synthase QueE [Candidatus Omnitrophota bacterium]
MEQAKISEIFLSHQGEGPFAGSRQLFIRFFGCNLSCDYCDTPLSSYRSFSKEGLLAKILDFGDDYNELTLTGGEPLLYPGFHSVFLPLFRKHREHRIYLETNGTLWEELRQVIDLVDIIAMDFKFQPSSGFAGDILEAHGKFFEIAVRKELIVKLVITESTNIEEITRAGIILSRFNDKDFTVVLQPVTPVRGPVNIPDGEMLGYFKEYLKNKTGKNIFILGQFHPLLGIK